MGAAFLARDGKFHAVVPGRDRQTELGGFPSIAAAKAAVEREVDTHAQGHTKDQRDQSQSRLAL